MKPRRYDDRVGFFTERVRGLRRRHEPPGRGRPVHHPLAAREEGPRRRGLRARRSRSSSTSAARCPTKWRPWIKKGVEAWQPAFEKAGFKNAIIAKDAPTRREDPDWDAEDARYSSIRWLPSTIENAMGPHVHDPRTGEILESDILIYHNVLKLIRDWYFVQASPNDPQAQQLPLPDDLIGEFLRLRRRARGRPHARLPAQHEGQLRRTPSSSSATPSSPRRTASRRRSWTTAASTTSPSPATAPG